MLFLVRLELVVMTIEEGILKNKISYNLCHTVQQWEQFSGFVAKIQTYARYQLEQIHIVQVHSVTETQ